MIKRFIFFSLFLFASDSYAQTLEEKIDAFVKQRQPVENMGLAVGVIQNGKVIFFKGYGYRDRKNKLPVTSSTVFAIGSNTKAFTALTISMLADEGQANLESPLAPQLPGFSMSSPEVTSNITPVDMLSHRTGLPRHDLLWYLTPFKREELFAKIPYLAFNKHDHMGFRENFQYNNLMYMTIGLWTEKITGKKWEEVVSQKILQPLRMDDTNFSNEVSQQAGDFAYPYIGEVQLPFKNIEAIGPAGSINSNINDMLKWVQFHLNHGVNENGDVLISKFAHERTLKPESDASAIFPSPNKVMYGLGWFLSEIRSKKVVWHGGNIDGFSSFVSFVPDENIGVVILTNEAKGSLFEFPITVPVPNTQNEIKLLPLVIYEHLLEDKSNLNVISNNMNIDFKSLSGLGISKLEVQSLFNLNSNISGSSHLLYEDSPLELNSQEYVGTYSEVAYGDIAISNDNGQLFLNYYDNHWPLKPTSEKDKFIATPHIEGEELELPVMFNRDPNGSLQNMNIVLEESVEPIVFAK